MGFQPGNHARKRTKTRVVTLCNGYKKRLRAEYDKLGGWRKVGAQYGVSGALVYRVVMTDYEPKDPEIRHRLGAPVLGLVQCMVDEVLPPGTQVMGSACCARCGRPFVPNHPLRKKCYICAPYRGRRKV